MEISYKTKKIDTPIESAFAKLNTYQTLIKLKVNSNLTKYLHKDELMKVKFKVDCYPSFGFNVESKWLDNPEYASVNVLDLPSLFAGKIHAILCRTYKNNVKGRDYYDFLFFIRKRDLDPKGKQVSFYLIWYGIGRFFIEGLRTDSLYFGSVRISQLVSGLMVVSGFVLLAIYCYRHRKKKKDSFEIIMDAIKKPL